MKPFYSMINKIITSPYHNQMIRSAAPLKNFFAINHFWYYKITFAGNYSYIGTHTAWSEFCFSKSLVSHFPCLRHPANLKSGVCFMKANASNDYKSVIDLAWEKFRINFNINLQYSIENGMEAFGFATQYHDPKAEERLINNLPLLRYFINFFRKKNRKIFELLEDNQVNLPEHFGEKFYECEKEVLIPDVREKFLCQIGFEEVLKLTKRERDVLKYVSCGYPASYIGKELGLSVKTIENYLLTIKSKLSCSSKVELIQKAQEIASTGYFLR